MKPIPAIAATLLALTFSAADPAEGAGQQSQRAAVSEQWNPARTPPGGTSWALLEQTRLNDRTDPKTKMIYTRPTFPPRVQALAGREIKVAGWMMPLENGSRQKHFVLLAYPPGCPFHMHALPNQFIEVYAATPVRVDGINPTVVTGRLELTGQDESGIFYKLRNARPG
jgi:hypothetical protein